MTCAVINTGKPVRILDKTVHYTCFFTSLRHSLIVGWISCAEEAGKCFQRYRWLVASLYYSKDWQTSAVCNSNFQLLGANKLVQQNTVVLYSVVLWYQDKPPPFFNPPSCPSDHQAIRCKSSENPISHRATIQSLRAKVRGKAVQGQRAHAV